MTFPGLALPFSILTLTVPEANVAETANSVSFDEVAYNEPPHLDQHCFHSSL